jgi:hypothetical protein
LIEFGNEQFHVIRVWEVNVENSSTTNVVWHGSSTNAMGLVPPYKVAQMGLTSLIFFARICLLRMIRYKVFRLYNKL